MLARHIQDASRALDDAAQLLGRIQLQPEHDAEAVAQRVGHLAGARRRADQGKTRQVDADRPRRRSLTNDDIQRKILHRGIEDLLDRTVEPVDLVDKQNIIFRKVCQQSRQIPRFFDRGTARNTDIDTHLVCDNACQRGLAQTGRAIEQRMVERLPAHFGGLNVDLQIFLCLGLPDVVRHGLGAQRVFGFVLRKLPRRNNALIIGHAAGKFDTQAYTPLLFDQFFQALADNLLRLHARSVQPFHSVQRLGLGVAQHHERGHCLLRVVDAACSSLRHHR